MENGKGACLVHSILKYTYGIVFLVAGADKFFNMITNWTYYVGPIAIRIIPIDLAQLIMVVGAIEVIIGGLILAGKTRIGGILAAAWFIIVSANLLSMGMYYDVAIRDLVLAVGAICLVLLSCDKKKK